MKVSELIEALRQLPQDMEVATQRGDFPNDYFTHGEPRIERMVVSGGHLTLEKWRPAATDKRGEMVCV